MSHIDVMCDIIVGNADILGSAEFSALLVFLFMRRIRSLRQGKSIGC